MKKIISMILVVATLCLSLVALTSCGISGTYTDKLTGLTTLEFSGKEVTISIGNISSTAKYEIKSEGDEKTITFSYEDVEKEQSGFKGTLPFAEGKEDGQKYIKIGAFTYIKK